LSLLFAPHVGEVVVMDPEPGMIEEGKRRAAHAGVTNLTFVLGGSEDLGAELGSFATVAISQALHWMHDQDRVLRDLGRLANTIALVGYVKEPDYNYAWLGEPLWSAIDEVVARHADPAPPRRPHDPFPELLARSPFSLVELLTHEYVAKTRPSVDAAIGLQYSLSNMLARLGDRKEAFEADARTTLAEIDTTTPFDVRLVDSALIGRQDRRARQLAR
jgi:SAM-dependent methyltransferase